jgi:mannose-6-phosphate isomerase-like protein (cupin superfamily)
MAVRRLVTGQTPDGRSVIVTDELLEPVTVAMMPGAEFYGIWGSDTPAVLPNDGSVPAVGRWFPPPSGFRFVVVTLPPADTPAPEPVDPDAAAAEMEEKLPGLLETLEPDSPGMHTTDTVDLLLVLSGEVTLELDDGAEVHLRAGDTVVQNGTRHAWRNTSAEPCVLAGAQVGAVRLARGR